MDPPIDRLSAALAGRDRLSIAPEFLLYLPGFEANRWMPGDRVLGVRWEPNAATVLRLDRRPVTTDSLFADNEFLFPSPDGRWIAYLNKASTEAWIEPLPRDGRRFLAAADNQVEEMAWLSASELIYRQGAVARPIPYLRVLPRWVERMERAVDAADRSGPK